MQGQLFTDHGQPTPGLCECGCGEPAPLSPWNVPKLGFRKGEPQRFIKGHRARRNNFWLEEDRGHLTPCWIWQGPARSDGYGLISRGGRRYLAHRQLYIEMIGPFDESLHIDHLCCVKPCVNPAHLEPVTQSENSKRAARRRWGKKNDPQMML